MGEGALVVVGGGWRSGGRAGRNEEMFESNANYTLLFVHFSEWILW